ncbi:uncharacterized protein PFL1_01190 [Pseudozyma flocculosa PF-1]|uniref:Uncharacterized protein n=1 Tax=Pseudozyma flocculosa TaxID=84751 RepID=A0A5C3EXD8_9BASI|nr:uncharacterized protein PFL1_01190 [Pseudozyma flocculosa PF-1]EPQ31001.1 hypothetical protein PFL1_01190 [Pseudozyma flocculosa PF-1]SPO35839.1 uncharacterized protein PSFLO_01310 [Pseudozyma flocculosa]
MSYTIAGTKILNEYLVLGVLGTYAAIGYSKMAGGSSQPSPAGGASPDSKKAAAPEPPINASSSDEEAFIKQFLAEAEGNGDRLV